MLEALEQVCGSTFGPEETIDRLREHHRDLERRLLELDSHVFLSVQEQLERKRIQKLKLLCKDQIALIRAQG